MILFTRNRHDHCHSRPIPRSLGTPLRTNPRMLRSRLGFYLKSSVIVELASCISPGYRSLFATYRHPCVPDLQTTEGGSINYDDTPSHDPPDVSSTQENMRERSLVKAWLGWGPALRTNRR